jgi:hypothetical protein
MALLIQEVIRPNLRRACITARRAFREQFPMHRVAKVMLRADEEDRYVIWISYGDTIPPRSKFYAIDKATGDVNLIEDNEAYRPKRKAVMR